MPKTIQVRNYFALRPEHWRVLTAIENAMRDHEFVELNLIHKLSGINHNGSSFVKILRNDLIPARVVAFNNNAYRLTNLGYDYLALHHFEKCGIVSDLSNFQLIGTGKESDIYLCRAGHGTVDKCGIEFQSPIVLKFHRLGRTSFKQVVNKREYKTGPKCSWNHLNRISCAREFSTMSALFNANVPVPVPVAHNRGAVAMEFVNHSYPLFKFAKIVLRNGAANLLFKQAAQILMKFAELGLVHGDLNEFNLLVETTGDGEDTHVGAYEDDMPDEVTEDDYEDEEDEESEDEEEEDIETSEDEGEEEDQSSDYADEEVAKCPYINDDIHSFKLTVIDFPQTISRNNKIAQEIYARDRQGLVDFFAKFTELSDDDLPPLLIADIERKKYLDVDLKAPGYPRKQELREARIGEEELGEEVEGADEEEAEVEPKIKEQVVTIESIKRRAQKEHAKKNKKASINKQQRNTKKEAFRNDMKFDF